MPTYRALEDNTNFGMGSYSEGRIISHSGWPRCCSGSVEPVDDGAQRIMAYWSRNIRNALPKSPWVSDHGRIFLPAHLPAMRGTRLPSLPGETFEGMPRYRANREGEFGNVKVKRGDEIAFCAWPESVFCLKPINDEAHQVVEYFAANSDNPRLLAAPWCEYAREIFLPELPPVHSRGMPEYSGEVMPPQVEGVGSRVSFARRRGQERS